MSEQNDRPNDIDEHPEDGFEHKLVLLHEELARAQPDRTPDRREQETEIDPTLKPAADVLRLIERVRRLENTAASAPPEDLDQRELPTQIGRFETIRKLGEGGYGVVALAHDPRLNRQVALKVPRPQALMTAELRTRFFREAKAAAALNHPKVVPVFEVGNAGPICYIASQYVEGPTLSALLAGRSEPLEPRECARLVASLADAVQHAHSRGVLHRDIKPSNVLLEWSGPSDELDSIDLADAARITDFGLAKLESVGEQDTRTGSVIGTPSYMSPEQAAGTKEGVGPATDVYSLGALLYELLTGRPPFHEETLLATLQQVRGQEPTPPRSIRPTIPRDLEAVCLQCLEKNPAARYESAAALGADLHRFLDGEPVRARHVSDLERLGRWCRRNPLVSSLSLAVCLLAIISTVAALLLARSRSEAIDNLQQADQARRIATRNAFDANVAHANSVRRTGRTGHRHESVAALAAAMDDAEELQIDAARRLELRNEAIASLSLHDLVVDQQWNMNTANDVYTTTDANCERIVRVDGNDLLVCDMQSGDEIQRLKLDEDRINRYVGFAFSDDGKFLGARYERAPGKERVHVWRPDTGESLGSVVVGGFGSASGFTSDGTQLVLAGSKPSEVEIRDLPSLELDSSIDLGQRIETLSVHPSQPYAACFIAPGTIEIRNLQSGELARTLAVDSYVYSMSWSDDGNRFAAICRDGTVSLYDGRVDVATASKKPIWKRKGHAAMGVRSGWHPNGLWFASSSMDGVTQLWDVDSGTVLVSADGIMTRFSNDGRWLGSTSGRWQILGGDEYSVAGQPDAPTNPMLDFGLTKRKGVTSEINHWEPYPGGRLVIGQNFFGVVFRDVTQDAPLAQAGLAGCGFRFNPSGTELIAVSINAGIQRLPVHVEESDDEIEITIGPPEPVLRTIPGMFAVGDNDQLLVAPFLNTPTLINTQAGKVVRRLAPRHTMAFWCDISPDGQYLATGAFHGREIHIQERDSGQLAVKLESGRACPWFSPDNRILAVAELGRYTFWEVGTWELLAEMRPVSRGIWPGGLAFTSDGQVVAIEDGSRVRLLRTTDFQPIAEFPLPPGQIVESIRFTPDGDFLLVGGGDENHSHFWNVTAIRRQLAELDLDWELETRASRDQLDPTKPLVLKLDLGALKKGEL